MNEAISTAAKAIEFCDQCKSLHDPDMPLGVAFEGLALCHSCYKAAEASRRKGWR